MALPFFWVGMKTDLLQSRGHCWVFQNCWHIEPSTLTASSFRVCNSSAGIPSPLLALFVVMLPEAHYTSHLRMSGRIWVTTTVWSSTSLRYFLCSFSVCSCHLFLISSASVRVHTISVLYCSHLCMKCSLGIFYFLEDISSLSPEKAMAPYSSTLAWKIPWTEERGRLQSMGLQRVGHDWVTSLFSL